MRWMSLGNKSSRRARSVTPRDGPYLNSGKIRQTLVTVVAAFMARNGVYLKPQRKSTAFSNMSPQSDNVLFVPNRNVLLTEARWGVGNGPTPDGTEGARPA